MKDFFKKCRLEAGLMVLTGLFAACGGGGGSEEEQAVAQAREFAECYFNFRFDEAYRCCTPESRAWIALKASNVNAKDVEAANRNGRETRVEIGDFRRDKDSDSCATVRCTAYGVLLSDSLERAGAVSERAVFVVPLVRRAGQWLVKMEAPLRSAR